MSTLLPPPHIDWACDALFLDFDGTLVDFADRPDGVQVAGSLMRTLTEIFEVADGGLAIVTGRTLAEIDAFLEPLKLPVAGVHGLVRRDGRGEVRKATVDDDALADVARAFDAFASRHDGVLVERKSHSVALHYRRAPALEADCRAVAEAALALTVGFDLQVGKCVVEVRASGHDKGSAIEALLQTPELEGRRPIFIGDDVTDEAGFQVVNARGGVSVKVGAGETVAHYRLDGVGAVHDWLASQMRKSGEPAPSVG